MGPRRHLTYSNVMSALAVFLVLAGGTALAAGLPKNSVTSKTVKDGSLKSADLADGSGVSGADVADGSLGGADVADGSLGGSDVTDGALGGADLGQGSIGGADLGQAAVGPGALNPDLVDSSTVLNNSLRGSDFGARTLSGSNINESTLARVPNAVALAGHPPSTLASSDIYERATPNDQGVELLDGTFMKTKGCDSPADLLLGGGIIDVGIAGTILQSTLNLTNEWEGIVSHGAAGSNWSVHVICARQRTP